MTFERGCGCWNRASFILVLCTAGAIASYGQTLTTLVSFNGINGSAPQWALVQGLDGNLYGTTYNGGDSVFPACYLGCGTVFSVTPGGTLTTLHSFCIQAGCVDGANPISGLVQATDGNFYGTTYYSETNANGTIFKISPSGSLTTVYNFDYTEGAQPYGGPVQGANGALYGPAFGGAINACVGGCGTIFRITPMGTLTTLHEFDSTDGAEPYAQLIQATNGAFYGTTERGGTYNEGTVFRVTPGGTLTTLHNFDLTDGSSPRGRLVQAIDGTLYGTTYYGGAHNSGTVFKMTPSGALTTLYSFTGGSDGGEPNAGLIEATDGNFYGTTLNGGIVTSCSVGCGTVFQVTSGGTLTTLHTFNVNDGGHPNGGLIQATDGNFYGTTSIGGASDDGTIFSLTVGLRAYVITQPSSGKAGTAVKILGTNLTGATSVSFNGTAARFKVVSTAEISTVVPAGAASGKVRVTTPGGTLASNPPFHVQP